MNKNEFNDIVPSIVERIDKQNKIDILYNNIFSIVPFPELLCMCKKLINANSNYIVDVNENYIKANKFREELSITVNLDEKKLKLYTTEWGQTDITRVFFKRYDNDCIFVRQSQEIKYQGDTGIRRIVKSSLFDEEGKLIYVSQSDIVDMDYWQKEKHIISNKCEITEIFVDNSTRCAYTKDFKNNETKYYVIENIPLLLSNDIDFFGSLNYRVKREVDKNTFEKHDLTDRMKLLRKCQ